MAVRKATKEKLEEERDRLLKEYQELSSSEDELIKHGKQRYKVMEDLSELNNKLKEIDKVKDSK